MGAPQPRQKTWSVYIWVWPLTNGVKTSPTACFYCRSTNDVDWCVQSWHSTARYTYTSESW